jgi:hypothetical protein
MLSESVTIVIHVLGGIAAVAIRIPHNSAQKLLPGPFGTFEKYAVVSIVCFLSSAVSRLLLFLFSFKSVTKMFSCFVLKIADAPMQFWVGQLMRDPSVYATFFFLNTGSLPFR